ncbi:MAG TPA: hypothetical protein ENJ09_09560 [Planctomycetes bacterium]|nr:hypothetical protein [Planctomycetota bacterium]
MVPRFQNTSARHRSVLLALAAGFAAGLAACAGTGSSQNAAPAERVDPTHVPALRTLGAAVEGRDDELARRMLTSLRRRPHGEAEDRILDSFERILTGREIVDRLAIDLADEHGRLVATIEATPGPAFFLRLPPADLESETVAVDGQGIETRDLRRSIVSLGDGIEVEPGTPVRIDLGDSRLRPLGSALGLRRTWRLTLRSGEVVRGEQAYPAADLPRADLTEVDLADALGEAGPVSPDAFTAAVERVLVGEGPERLELLKLALRIPEPARDEVLDRLGRLFSENGPGAPRAAVDTEAGVTLEPALRWVSGAREPGTGFLAWRNWLRHRSLAEQARRSGSAGGGLDLPDPIGSSTAR